MPPTLFAQTLVFAQSVLLLADWKHYVFGTLMFLTSVFLILLVLVQRGRGGGLTGALGGMGGQSAFGTKAGDIFTRVTMVTAAIWILLCILALKVLSPIEEPQPLSPGAAVTGVPSPDETSEEGSDDSATEDVLGDVGLDSSGAGEDASGDVSGTQDTDSSQTPSTGDTGSEEPGGESSESQ